MADTQGDAIIIKKYANRRLYDTTPRPPADM